MYYLIPHGRKLFELQKKRRNLRVSLTLLQNGFAFPIPSSSSGYATDVRSKVGRKDKTFTVSYLVDSLGLTRNLAESISTKVSFKDKGNPDSVLSLLRTHGFTDSQISSIITDYPLLLIADAEKSLAPKLQFLISRGASTSELTEVVSKVPEILGKYRNMSVYYDFVKEVIEAEKSSKLETFRHSLPQGKLENKIRNLFALRELGMPQQMLFPLLMSSCSYVCGKQKFGESLKKVVEMGFDPTSLRFLEALRIVQGLKNETIEEKVKVYTSLGFAVGDVWAIFKKYPISLTISAKKITQNFEAVKGFGLMEEEARLVVKKHPQCLGVSEKNLLNSREKFIGLGFSIDEIAMMVKRVPACIGYSVETVKKKIEYVSREMNWPLKAVASYPHVLGYSLEKRTVPRCNVIKALMSKGLLGSQLPNISAVLLCTDENFLKRFVKKHGANEELVLELMDIFSGKKRACE